MATCSVQGKLDPELDVKRRLRLRELSRYYCAISALPEPEPEPEPTPTADRTNVGDSNPTADSALPRLADDAHLTALAQLAALRMGGERSFISIIDDQTQYIVAEATRSISLVHRDVHAPGDSLVFGMQALPISCGLCPVLLRAFLGETDLKLHRPGNSVDESCIIIGDLFEENCTCNNPAVVAYPHVLRYYVAVPLKTASGHVIGSMCVTDSAARRPGPIDIIPLQEIAKLVVEHLDSIRMREDHRRAERLLEGLNHFVRGKSSLSLWSQSTKGQKNIPSAFPEPTGVSSAKLLQDRTTDSAHDRSQDMAANTESESATSTMPSSATARQSSAISLTPSTTPTSKANGTAVAAPVSVSSEIEVGFDPLPGSESSEDVRSAILPSTNIRQAFARASNLIRESMDLDATCFLEVPSNERYKSVKPGRPRNNQVKIEEESPADDSEPSTDSSFDLVSKEEAQDKAGETLEDTATDDLLCHRLGYSTGTKSSLANSSTTTNFLTIPARLLNRLASKYPEGRIFHFDSAGGVSSGDDDRRKPNRESNKGRRERKVSDHLFRLFPSARSLIFFPLFDNDRQHVYAGFLGWTTNPARALQKTEMVYVSGFANSIMCEVMRLGAVATDKAKSNFISSMSHELRSPLHGILAAGQLLSESQVDRQQAEFVQMVDTCARTLLDTMNHLLDHAKINHFTERRTKKSRPVMKRARKSDNETYSLVSDMTLLAVVEETATSMAASSHQLVRSSGGAVAGVSNINTYKGINPRSETLSVPIILEIKPCKEWSFLSEPGSWRRIIMNLVGNSLKYTQHGHILLELQVKESDSPKNSKKRHLAELKVTDTGQGISEEYLQHRLYTPFAQEDNLSVGAGLGLSLVNQIVSSLQGQIQIRSEVGTGTEITVQIPLEASNTLTLGIPDGKLAALTSKRSIKFCGFDDQPSIFESPTGILDPRTQALLAMKVSILHLATDWFGLVMTTSNPDVYVVEESFLDARLDEFDRSENSILVIGLDGRGSSANKLRHADFFYMLPPIGPKRMGEALKSLFEARPATQRSLAVREQPALASSLPIDSSQLKPDVSDPDPLANSRFRPSMVDANPLLPAPGENHKHPNDFGRTSQIDSIVSKNSHSSLRNEIPPMTPDMTKRIALLVDDNEINLRLLVACVTRLRDIEYITATNGKDALEKYQTAVEAGRKISIVFMDISMPVMDGFESTRRIRMYETKKGLALGDRTKIIALTGLASAEAQNQIDECGFNVYLRKPVNLKTLRKMIADEEDDLPHD